MRNAIRDVEKGFTLIPRTGEQFATIDILFEETLPMDAEILQAELKTTDGENIPRLITDTIPPKPEAYDVKHIEIAFDSRPSFGNEKLILTLLLDAKDGMGKVKYAIYMEGTNAKEIKEIPYKGL